MFLADPPTGKLITNQSSWLPLLTPEREGAGVNWFLTWGKYGVAPGVRPEGWLRWALGAAVCRDHA